MINEEKPTTSQLTADMINVILDSIRNEFPDGASQNDLMSYVMTSFINSLGFFLGEIVCIKDAYTIKEIFIKMQKYLLLLLKYPGNGLDS